MLQIEVIVSSSPRLWQARLIERLEAAGHAVAVGVTDAADPLPFGARLTLTAEARLLRRGPLLASPVAIAPRRGNGSPDLRIDLTGEHAPASVPTMRIAFDGYASDAALPSILAAGRLPDIELVLDGGLFDRAAPMIDNRVIVIAAAEDVLARAITVALKGVARFARGKRQTAPFLFVSGRPPFGLPYLTSALPRLGREALRRSRYRYAHWRVGYRLIDGPGVAESGELGTGWSVLPDDGTRFFADPFPFEHDGRRYIFVEDYPHAAAKAVISVSALDERGIAAPPRLVLEEPHHLSYPQVFRSDGAIWMLPEGSAGGKLTLYRAKRFPDQWQPVATLAHGTICDATLLQRDDGWWLFATDRDGAGSTSDTLVVFHAPALTGPWSPHPQNPILIDRRRARPGGAFVTIGGRLFLPVQDGTLGYGGGLGLSALKRLDADHVELGDPRPVHGTGDFPYPQMHTLNRAGPLEVIDGIAAMRKS